MKPKVQMRVYRGPLAEGLPFYAYNGDTGIQLPAAVETVIPPHSVKEIITDLYFVIPDGYYIDIRSRGASAKLRVGFKLTIVDGTYQGPLDVLADNDSDDWILVQRGDVVAQGILTEFEVAEFVEISQEEFAKIPPTDRGAGRMGSSGNKARKLTTEELIARGLITPEGKVVEDPAQVFLSLEGRQ